tara:strand:- start:4680 stop:5342 length:663 start_codon:yes stop_codon:yes gene_type:complete
MCGGYTVAQLKEIIKNHKKTNCPAISRKRKNELLEIIKILNIEQPVERKKNEPKKERPKVILRKTDKIDLEDLDKIELIGGDNLIEYTDSSSKFKDNIKKLYPYGYQNLKLALEALRKQNKKDKTFLDIDDYFKKELKKSVFFNKAFFKKFVKREGEATSKSIIRLLFKEINRKFTTHDIVIPSEQIKPNSGRITNEGKGLDGGMFVSSFGKVSYNKKDK